MLPRVIADDNIPFLKGVLEPFATVSYHPGHLIDHSHLINADALIVRTRTLCSADLLEGTAVKIIASATIGYDHIDTSYCDSRNIRWVNAPGCNAASVCQYLASALFVLARKKNLSLANKTIGIIGVGNVGSKVEKLARILDMKVLLNDPPRQRVEGKDGFVTLDRLLSESDFITLHVPLTSNGPDRTFHLIDETTLERIKPGSFLINTSRGEVIDTLALKNFIRMGFLSGVLLDVWENEPAPDPELLSMATIATPHIAGYSIDGKANGTAAVVRAISGYFNFPLYSWAPDHLPPPGKKVIRIDGSGKTTEQIIGEVILESYDVARDDAALRKEPGLFEQLRRNYPVRREFPASGVILQNGTVAANETITKLGFTRDLY